MTGALLKVVAQLVLLLMLAPLVSGFIKTLKARLQMRRGPRLLQSYSNIHKLLRKGMVIPDTASWLFSATPYVVFVATLLAGLMAPMVVADTPIGLFGGVLAVVYLLGLGRFFVALAGLDAGSPFGGLGSSREMTVSALAEPTLMLAVFTVAIGAGSTSLAEIARVAINQQWRFLAPSQALAFAALFLVLIAETGRIPVDNPATWSPAGVLAAFGWLALKLLLLSCAVVLVETANAKMRLFRVPELMAVAFTLGALALISTFLF